LLFLLLYSPLVEWNSIMCFELDESLTLVEFSLLLEVRFEWHIIRIHLLKTSVSRFHLDIIWRHFIKTSVVLLFSVIDVYLIEYLFDLCSGSLILWCSALLVLFFPSFLADLLPKSLLEIRHCSREALPEEDWNVDCDNWCC